MRLRRRVGGGAGGGSEFSEQTRRVIFLTMRDRMLITSPLDAARARKSTRRVFLDFRSSLIGSQHLVKFRSFSTVRAGPLWCCRLCSCRILVDMQRQSLRNSTPACSNLKSCLLAAPLPREPRREPRTHQNMLKMHANPGSDWTPKVIGLKCCKIIKVSSPQ